ILNFVYLSFLKYPSILNEIIPFVTIISITFLIRNLISNNEFVSMRNLGYSIFDIFKPISIAIFVMGIFFLLFINPLSVFMGSKYDNKLDNKDNSLYSIKISNNEMWIKNEIDEKNYSFINIKNINLKNMNADNIQILLINNQGNKFIMAKKGEFDKNLFILTEVKYYDFNSEEFSNLEKYNLIINFNKENLINSISEYKLVPFYKYFNHSKTLSKFNLYSSEIGLYYLSEILKPIFSVVLAFVILGFTSKFQRNENFFKVLFIAVSIGFLVFLFKEIITKLTITLSLNFLLSYLIIFLVPFFIGLYQIIKIEND
ncbi:LptF/LptG family permease, partial [Pelagibacteraceae bacterium]|nr:LptF/LptG family permease [Pelagibacteraceae bacterium]